jgi:hypothetical protein
MINVGRITVSQNFRQPEGFVVHRKIGHWEKGKFIQTEKSILMQGTIINASPKEINQLPEGDRITGMMAIYSPEAIFITRVATSNCKNSSSGTSDEIEWKGKRYRIVNINPWQEFGYYKAFAVYMEGE